MSTIEQQQLTSYNVNLDALAKEAKLDEKEKPFLQALGTGDSVKAIDVFNNIKKIDGDDKLTQIDLSGLRIGVSDKTITEAKVRDTFGAKDGSLEETKLQTLKTNGVLVSSAAPTKTETISLNMLTIDELRNPTNFDAWMRHIIPRSGDEVVDTKQNKKVQSSINTKLLNDAMKLLMDNNESELMKKVCYLCLTNDLKTQEAENIKASAALLTALFKQKEEGRVSLGKDGQITTAAVNDLATYLEITPPGYERWHNQVGSLLGGDWLPWITSSATGQKGFNFTESGVPKNEQNHGLGVTGSVVSTVVLGGVGYAIAANFWNPVGWGLAGAVAIGGLFSSLGITNGIDWATKKSDWWKSLRDPDVQQQCIEYVKPSMNTGTPATFNVNRNNQNTVVTPTSSPNPSPTPVGSPPPDNQQPKQGRDMTKGE